MDTEDTQNEKADMTFRERKRETTSSQQSEEEKEGDEDNTDDVADNYSENFTVSNVKAQSIAFIYNTKSGSTSE